MPQLTVNGRQVAVDPGTTILEAARRLGIEVPTLCHLPGAAPYTSCMVCVVREAASGRLVPACSAPAEDGMAVETDGDEVRQARRNALDFLLGEHVGDCNALCRLGCPARMDIPLMIRQIAAGDLRAAAATAKDALVLPATLGRICPAPCEKSCRRSRCDAPLAIGLLHRHVADIDRAGPASYVPECKPATGKKAAIIGAGPAGLAAAYHLAQAGHSCAVFDDQAEAGGHLRRDWPAEVLPPDVLDSEIDAIRKLGVAFRLNTRIGIEVSMAQLNSDFDAIVLSPGQPHAGLASAWGVDVDALGISVYADSFRTSDPKIFAGGEAVHHGRLVVRAIAQGKIIARTVDQYLGGLAVAEPMAQCQSRMGQLQAAELKEHMKGADESPGVAPAGGPAAGFSGKEAAAEARRCMRCDCRKLEDCKLRKLAEEYGADQHRFKVEGRRRFERNTTHPDIVFEPGKCIRCGICVRIAGRAGDKPGLAFVGRGFAATVEAPFNEPLSAALKNSAEECVRRCPTGALASRL